MKKTIAILALIISSTSFGIEKYPVEHFFKDSAMLSPELSPDGQYLAALTPLNINKETVSRCKKKTTKNKSRSGVVDFCDVCLLYTSPSPRDGLLSRMPSSA